jgi:hypothetical protein
MFADFAPAPGLTKRDPAVSQVPEEIHWSRGLSIFPYFPRRIYGSAAALSIRSWGSCRYPEEALSQLFQPLVSVLPGFGQYALHYRAEPWLAPIISRCRLRTGRITEVGALKQGACCRGIELRIIAVRERKSRRCIAGPCILIYERSRHS